MPPGAESAPRSRSRRWTAPPSRCFRSCTGTSSASALRDDGIDALKERYLFTWSENQRFYHGVLPLLRAFEQAGIDAVVLKGLALIARFYRDPGLRPMADVDVLVPPSDVERASELAVSLGWHPRYRLTPAFLRVKHAGPFDHRTGVACDIHWRVFEEAGGGGADDDFRAAAEPVTFQGTRLRILSPTDQLLHVCGHAARWGEVPAIRWVADAVLILREGPIDWQRFLVHAAQRRFILRMRQMLGYLRQALGVAIPPSVEADAGPTAGVDARAARVSSPEPRTSAARGAADLRVQLPSRRAAPAARVPRLPPGCVGARVAGRGATTRARSRRTADALGDGEPAKSTPDDAGGGRTAMSYRSDGRPAAGRYGLGREPAEAEQEAPDSHRPASPRVMDDARSRIAAAASWASPRSPV